MATFTTRTVTSRRREWIVPAHPPWGAAWEEIDKAMVAAGHAYRAHHKLPEGGSIPGNALTLHPRDEEIVISFTEEHAE